MLTRRIKRDFNKVFSKYPFKITIKINKSTNNNYGNFFNIESGVLVESYEFEAIVNNPQPGVVKDEEYRVLDEEFSIFVKPHPTITITYDDEVEWEGKKFVITYIGGAVDEKGERLWYELRVKRK